MRILVIDDDVEVLFATSNLLVELGQEVYKARGGTEGLYTFRERGPFDCVVTDYQMPDMNGIDLTFAIRELEPTQKIVINTGSGTLAGCMEMYGLPDVPVILKSEQQALKSYIKSLEL